MEESDKTVDPEGVTSDEPGGTPPSAWAVPSSMSLDLGKRFGQLIGRYKVVRVLGEGGMGSVFLAEQDKPTRLVALKVIRPGVASANLLRRFEHEAQVLGRLQHPGIAQIYEAGTADTGEGAQPYFVMEYVRGRSLMEYAQASQLSTRQRLELLVKICDAVQHAHQKGIIHRDLKPGNILVTEEGQPKILDFGVARATDADIQATTIQTDVGQLVGTIPYMSPEQAGGDVTELDTRSDVYALGVLGYELLAGRLPYELKNKMIHEAVRVIREDDPTPLSSIDRVFRGDVETIITKALQKDRERRYQSAIELRDDISRYLKNLPILARRPSAVYHLQVFVRRNKAAVVAGVAIALLVVLFVAGGLWAAVVALVLGLTGTSWQYLQVTRAKAEATQQRDEAIKARQMAEIERTRAVDAEQHTQEQRNEAEKARQAAELEARKTLAINDFLIRDILTSADPAEFQDREITVREVLDNAARKVEQAFADEPLLQAVIRDTIAATYKSLGKHDAAEPHLRAALAIRRTLDPQNLPEIATSLNSLARLLYEMDDYEAAEPLFREAIDIRRDILGDKHPQLAAALNNLSSVRRARGDYKEAEALCREALTINKAVYGEEHHAVATSLTKLAKLLQAKGDHHEAESRFREATKLQKKILGPDHLHVAFSLNNLANLLQRTGEYDAAEPILREALQIFRMRLGERHRNVLAALNNLANLLRHKGDNDAAAPIFQQVVELSEALDLPDRWSVVRFHESYATCLTELKRYEQAEKQLLAARDLLKEATASQPDRLREVENKLSTLYDKWGKPDQGHRVAGEAARSRRERR